MTTVPAAPRTLGPTWDRTADVLVLVGAALLTIVVSALAVSEPRVGVAAAGGVALFAVTVARPARAAPLFLALTPLLAGFERDAVLPVLRPSEALLALLLAAVALRALVDGLDGRMPGYVPTTVDRALVVLATLGSVVPLVWLVARAQRPTTDDLLFSVTLWKYLLVFVLFRLVVTTTAEVRRCLDTMLGVGVVVAVIAILQGVGVTPVVQLIGTIYGEPIDQIGGNRGTSTLGTSHGVADIMAFDLAIAVAYLQKGLGHRRLLAGLAALFGLACFASGQFSALFAVAVCAVTLAMLSGRPAQVARYAIPGTVVSLGLLQPVVQARLASTDESGVPSSWAARRMNLENYFWPPLFDGFNWVLGVRPAGRLASYEPWREWVYIESGHTWLLWTGGLPFVAAYFWMCWVVARPALALSRRDGMAGVVGISVSVAFWVVFVLMLLDVHLTMRGPADAFFPFLALLAVPVLWEGRETERVRLLGADPVRRRP